MLCEKCRQREATVHKTSYVAQIDVDDSAETPEPTEINLCWECYQETDPETASMMRAGCHYCGGPFASSATDPSDMTSEEPKQFGLCERCADEFHGYINRIVPSWGASVPTDEEMHRLMRAFAQLDQHMKEWVSRRGEDDNA